MEKISIQQRKEFLQELFAHITFNRETITVKFQGLGTFDVAMMMYDHNGNICTGYVGINKSTGDFLSFITLKPLTSDIREDIKESYPFAEIKITDYTGVFTISFAHNTWVNELAVSFATAAFLMVLNKYRELWLNYCKNIIRA